MLKKKKSCPRQTQIYGFLTYQKVFPPCLDRRESFAYPHGMCSEMLCHFWFGLIFWSFRYLCRPQNLNNGLKSQGLYCLGGNLEPWIADLIQRALGLKGPSWPPRVFWQKKNSRRIETIRTVPNLNLVSQNLVNHP